MQSFVKIMVWIYSLKIGHYHSFPDKRHGKEGGVGGGGQMKGGTLSQGEGGNLPSGGSFPLYAGLFTSCKEKKQTIMATFTPTKKIKHTMQFIHFITQFSDMHIHTSNILSNSIC